MLTGFALGVLATLAVAVIAGASLIGAGIASLAHLTDLDDTED